VFALPKSGRERIVPMCEWAAEAVRPHLKEYPPTPCSLPWEKPTGLPRPQGPGLHTPHVRPHVAELPPRSPQCHRHTHEGPFRWL
jgi:hypothetical protein